MAMTTGSENVFPDVRPVTSNAAKYPGAAPSNPTPAINRFAIRAIQFGLFPRYNQRAIPPCAIKNLPTNRILLPVLPPAYTQQVSATL